MASRSSSDWRSRSRISSRTPPAGPGFLDLAGRRLHAAVAVIGVRLHHLRGTPRKQQVGIGPRGQPHRSRGPAMDTDQRDHQQQGRIAIVATLDRPGKFRDGGARGAIDQPGQLTHEQAGQHTQRVHRAGSCCTGPAMP